MSENNNHPFKAAILGKLLQEAQKLLSQTLTTREFVLKQLYIGPMTVGQIARIIGKTRQNVQVLANQLVDEKLCLYRKNPFHIRSQLLELTLKGRKVATQEAKDFETMALRLTNDISIERLRDAMRVLEVMNK